MTDEQIIERIVAGITKGDERRQRVYWHMYANVDAFVRWHKSGRPTDISLFGQ